MAKAKKAEAEIACYKEQVDLIFKKIYADASTDIVIDFGHQLLLHPHERCGARLSLRSTLHDERSIRDALLQWRGSTTRASLHPSAFTSAYAREPLAEGALPSLRLALLRLPRHLHRTQLAPLVLLVVDLTEPAALAHPLRAWRGGAHRLAHAVDRLVGHRDDAALRRTDEDPAQLVARGRDVP
eukprot:CAMPEP_0205853528 /NCGR_PEP_ID=MMETSP1083-20121108/1601_1 /ASSEMBLY_ACC=CAM_ASM_000430 /TAXON_ID=97485 /ORGANISM="Prymnesium parvum, Strain Texoma1" /LENGTH=183 /DNA_ID=CAMNT_0053214805 /DNA_START=8 /DNA_END=555 /DNA_ORIENTATION=+